MKILKKLKKNFFFNFFSLRKILKFNMKPAILLHLQLQFQLILEYTIRLKLNRTRPTALRGNVTFWETTERAERSLSKRHAVSRAYSRAHFECISRRIEPEHVLWQVPRQLLEPSPQIQPGLGEEHCEEPLERRQTTRSFACPSAEFRERRLPERESCHFWKLGKRLHPHRIPASRDDSDVLADGLRAGDRSDHCDLWAEYGWCDWGVSSDSGYSVTGTHFDGVASVDG